jgi:methylated-DNA-protein-cysteine methyltransferase-like protein
MARARPRRTKAASSARGALEARADASSSAAKGELQCKLIYRVVRTIPHGRVATYGQLALLAGIPSGHRVAARAMRACPQGLPWYRVMGKKDARRAKIALVEPDHVREQQQRLRAEGVRFDADGYVALRQFGWLPVEAGASAREQNGRGPSQKRAKPALTASGKNKNR